MKFSTSLLIILIIGFVSAQNPADLVTTTNSPLFGEYQGSGKFYSGYLDIQDDNIKIHYWYFEAQQANERATAPLIVQLNSGPMCSAIANEATQGMAPLIFKEHAGTLEWNEYSWSIEANLLFIDPPGTGYSTDKTNPEKYNDTQMIDYQKRALRAFFTAAPTISSNAVYLAGLGYAGIYAPHLAADILNENEIKTSEYPAINLVGVITGNAAVTQTQIPSKNADTPYYSIEFLNTQGVINRDEFHKFQELCNEFDPQDDLAVNQSAQCKSYVDELKDRMHYLNIKAMDTDCFDLEQCQDQTDPLTFFNKSDVRKALHVDASTQFVVCNTNVQYENQKDSFLTYAKLIKAGLNLWTFAGDTDVEIPHNSVTHWIGSMRDDLGLADIINYSAWFHNSPIAGSDKNHIQQGGSYWKMDGLTYLRFKGCGENVYECAAPGALMMLKKMLSGPPSEGGSHMPLDPDNYNEYDSTA